MVVVTVVMTTLILQILMEQQVALVVVVLETGLFHLAEQETLHQLLHLRATMEVRVVVLVLGLDGEPAEAVVELALWDKMVNQPAEETEGTEQFRAFLDRP